MSEENNVETPVEESKLEKADQYVGQSRIVSSEPRENGFVHYDLEDGRSGLVKYDQFNSMAREAAYDDQMVMVYKWAPVSAQILKCLLDYRMPMSDLNFVTRQVQESIVENYEKAVSKLFKRQLTDHVRLDQVNEVLKTTTELIKE